MKYYCRVSHYFEKNRKEEEEEEIKEGQSSKWTSVSSVLRATNKSFFFWKTNYLFVLLHDALTSQFLTKCLLLFVSDSPSSEGGDAVSTNENI